MCKNILLIDDDEDEHLIFSEAVYEAGIDVKISFVKNALDGISLLQNLLFDFVFLDINMPLINGIECLELIKKDAVIKATPIIMYSTGVNDEISNQLVNKGAIACIKKQNNISYLANTLKQFLSVGES